MTGSELRAWRTQTRFSQARLARALEVHVDTVSRWECGTRAIPPFLPLALDSVVRHTAAAELANARAIVAAAESSAA